MCASAETSVSQPSYTWEGCHMSTHGCNAGGGDVVQDRGGEIVNIGV